MSPRFSAAFLVALLAITGCSSSTVTSPPMPAASLLPSNPIKHVIVLMQENRSFNNLFMSYPGADTSTTGLAQGESQPVTIHAITLEHGYIAGVQPGTDISHDHKSFQLEYNQGQMDGFNQETLSEIWGQGANAGHFPYSYVVRGETKPYWDMAKQYTLGDRMFSTETSGSFVAHQELIAGSTRLSATESLTDFPSSQPWGCDAPPGTVTDVIFTNGKVEEAAGPFPCFSQYKTMADLLDVSKVSWKYYVASLKDNDELSGQVWNGFDAIKSVACPSRNGAVCERGHDWQYISSPASNVLTDIKKGSLPSVSWVIPALYDSDHPGSGHNHGPSWVAAVVNAVGKSKYWDSTAIVVTWDEWGGFYDNVPPPQLDYTSLNFRVPLLIISPYAKTGYVSHTQYEIGSILRYIEQTFALGSLGSTDARSNSIIDSFDFTQAPTKFKVIPARYPESFFTGNRPRPSAADVKEILEEDGTPE
jgi:phospholipase C